ncbi:MAG: GIY-YIG nuclease family protein, partial [Bacteroidales bacterium]|nr:GIY-YIG nuclease family protein [Bacteroidales bacterium]
MIHNHEAGGSSPPLATKKPLQLFCSGFLYFYLMNFYTYIIYSASINRYYTGSCSDLKKRLQRHNDGATP